MGAEADIVVASAKAYLSARNKIQSQAERVVAQGQIAGDPFISIQEGDASN